MLAASIGLGWILVMGAGTAPQDAGRLQEENARLRAELERVTAELVRLKLQHADPDETVRLLREEALPSEFPAVQDVALERCGNLPPERFGEVAPAVGALIARMPPDRAAAAVRVFSAFADQPEARRAVLLLGGSPQAELRRAVAETLSGFRGEEVRAALLGLLDDGEDPRVRAAAAQSLVAQADDADRAAIGAAILARLRVEEDEAARERCVEAVGTLAVTEAVPVLLEFLGRADPSLRWASISALGRIGDPSAAASIVPFLAPEHPDNLRLVAIQSLGALRVPETVGPVAEAVRTDPVPANRAAAASALALFLQAEDIQQVLLPAYEAESDAGAKRAILDACMRIAAAGFDEEEEFLDALLSRGWLREADECGRRLHGSSTSAEERTRHFDHARRIADALFGAEMYREALDHYRYLAVVRPEDVEMVDRTLRCLRSTGAETDALLAWIQEQWVRTPEGAPAAWALADGRLQALQEAGRWSDLASAAYDIEHSQPHAPPDALRVRADDLYKRSMDELIRRAAGEGDGEREPARDALVGLGRRGMPVLIREFESTEATPERRAILHNIATAITGVQTELPAVVSTEQVREIASAWRRWMQTP